MRSRFGKRPLKDIEPWHNNFFIDQKIINDFGTRVIYFSSTYMFFVKITSEVEFNWLSIAGLREIWIR